MSSLKESLLDIQNIVDSKKFNEWRKSFIAKNISVFTYEEENKLEYTDIHRQYEEGVEKIIIENMPDDFDMKRFQERLPDYLEGPGGKDEEVGKAIQMLLEVSDYQQFKEMMMFLKKQEEENEMKDAGDDQLAGVTVDSAQLACLDIKGMMTMCATLAAATDDITGWENVLKNDWMQIDRMKVPEDRRKSKNDIFLKGVWTMNLTFEEACDMMFCLKDRRKKWDSNFTSASYPNGGSDLDNEIVVSVDLNFGYLINLVMFGNGSGTKLITKNIRRWDYPQPGSVTYAMFPWSIKENSIDANHSLLSLKTGTIAPHPTIKGKIVMTTVEINSMGGMPKWAQHWMLRAVAPSMMKGLETRYIANIRNKNEVVDVTPNGRSDRDEKKYDSKSNKK